MFKRIVLKSKREDATLCLHLQQKSPVSLHLAKSRDVSTSFGLFRVVVRKGHQDLELSDLLLSSEFEDQLSCGSCLTLND